MTAEKGPPPMFLQADSVCLAPTKHASRFDGMGLHGHKAHAMEPHLMVNVRQNGANTAATATVETVIVAFPGTSDGKDAITDLNISHNRTRAPGHSSAVYMQPGWHNGFMSCVHGLPIQLFQCLLSQVSC